MPHGVRRALEVLPHCEWGQPAFGVSRYRHSTPRGRTDMASNGKKKTTMAKLTRETKLSERRMDKQAKKDARKRAAADPTVDTTDPTVDATEAVADGE